MRKFPSRIGAPKRNPVWIMILLGISVVAVIGTAYTVFTQPTTVPGGNAIKSEVSDQAQKPIRELSAGWDYYPNFKDLAGNSTHIVIGQVMGIKAAYDKEDIPFTDYNLEINAVVKGNVNPGDMIVIRQTGAEGSDEIVELDDDPLLKQGETFVGFLRYSQDHGVYPIVGGPQGRYEVENGLVYSLDKYDPDADYLPNKADGKELNQFVQEIEEGMSSQ